MERKIIFELEIEATEDQPETGYKKGDKVLMENDIFNEHNGLAFFDLGKGWKINWKRQKVGQKDKLGKEVFEGDIFEDETFVVYQNGKFGTTYEDNNQGVAELNQKRCSFKIVVGNIYQNKS